MALMAVGLTAVACSSDDDGDPYPSLITEPMMITTNAAGVPLSFVTDNGTRYTLLNQLTEWPKDTVLRMVGGYVVEEPAKARLMTLSRMYVFHDCSSEAELYRDPTGVVSVWLGGGFINMHLLPMTQGGAQEWGYLRDSTCTNSRGGTTHHLSLYHSQKDDVAAYSGHLYCCIPLDSVASPRAGTDSIVLAIHTFNGQPAVWRF